jgi:hypothetical protein
MATTRLIVLSNGTWVKCPMEADIDYFRAVKESELANAPVASPKPRRKSASRSAGHTSRRVNYAARVLTSSSPFSAGMETTARRMDQLKENEASQ